MDGSDAGKLFLKYPPAALNSLLEAWQRYMASSEYHRQRARSDRRNMNSEQTFSLEPMFVHVQFENSSALKMKGAFSGVSVWPRLWTVGHFLRWLWCLEAKARVRRYTPCTQRDVDVLCRISMCAACLRSFALQLRVVVCIEVAKHGRWHR